MTVLLRSGILRLCAGAAGVLVLGAPTEVEAQRLPPRCGGSCPAFRCAMAGAPISESARMLAAAAA